MDESQGTAEIEIGDAVKIGMYGTVTEKVDGPVMGLTMLEILKILVRA